MKKGKLFYMVPKTDLREVKHLRNEFDGANAAFIRRAGDHFYEVRVRAVGGRAIQWGAPTAVLNDNAADLRGLALEVVPC